MIKVQITLVASPRNHLYRTDHLLIEVGPFFVGLKTEFDHFRCFRPGDRPDVIFMDVNLTGELDGIEATKQILEASNVPLIFVTAYADDAPTVTRIRSALGERIILGKPATRAGVQAALRQLQVI